MNLESPDFIFRIICEVLKDEFGYGGTITPSMTGADIGFDSLDYIELMMSLEDKFKIELDIDETDYTFKELADECSKIMETRRK